MSPVAGNTRSASRDLRTGARTRVTLPFGMSLTTRADFQARGNETNGLASRTLTFHYPYIDVEYGSITKIMLRDLKPGARLASDVKTREGVLIIAAGAAVTPLLLERLRNFARIAGIAEPLMIRA